MDTVLALNNSPYYYFKPSSQRSIGYTWPLTDRIVSKLADVMLDIFDELGLDMIPGIQLGAESDGALRNQRKRRAMRDISAEKGIEYIVHLPDQMVPGSYVKKGFQQQMLGILQGGHGKNIRDFESDVKERIAAADELEARYMVMHLPNGPFEEQAKVESYLTGGVHDILSETGIKMCIENCNNRDNPYYGDISNLHDLVNGLGDPYQMCFDYGHYLVDRDRTDMGELLSKCSGALVFHVHINDRTSDKHLFLGERPADADPTVLDDVEDAYVNCFLRGVDPKGKAFVLERNRQFEHAQIRSSVERLLGPLLS
ncbi:MAG TPA: TIM barrel protein [Candidatus Methanofastidiosa archaeon]|nr:TIM barrel protein [Candidatus Methanofastidiosa archaeon]HPR41701.1 TIM barrel protein [Candidatus Methanofastidiosa archaeon]